MSGLEIERKFLVRKNSDWKSQTYNVSTIKQGYIPAKNATVRVRLRDNKGYLTIKARTKNGLSRYEFEKEITLQEAKELFKLCDKNVISKRRYLLKAGKHTFEIDEFCGENEGLVMAEVELNSEDEEFIKPDFLGLEVTFDPRFYNSYLVFNPFSQWKDK